jgi:phosphocarrier protein FPr
MPAAPPPMTRVVLVAPLGGVLVALDEVPDPVFAQRMAGDGIAIDPRTSTLVAPCAGRVAHLHEAGHALTLVTPEGLEVMLHIGLDTVSLKGQGFTPRVAAGAVVRPGDPLVEFDAAFVAGHARSLLTQLVITNGERVARLTRATGTVRAGLDRVLEVELTVGAPEFVSAPVIVGLAHGLHARPAAAIVAAAQRFVSGVRISKGRDEANARSVVAILGLDVGRGDAVRVVAEGTDAAAAVEALSGLLCGGADETGSTPPDAGRVFTGVPASPGLAIGTTFQVRRRPVEVPEEGQGAEVERRRLWHAIAEAASQVAAAQRALASGTDAAGAAIMDAHRELLGDPTLLDAAETALAAGKGAAWAWRSAVDGQAAVLEQCRRPLLAARAGDVRDVGRRVLRILMGVPAAALDPPPGSILVADELSPSEAAGLDPTVVLGVCTVSGGATSHAAILARSLDLPAVTGLDPRVLELPDGTPAAIDGGRGTVSVDPPAAAVARVRDARVRRAARRAADLDAAQAPAVTRDGHRIAVAATIGGLGEAARVAGRGGDGVGLLRSEFLFLGRDEAPGEDEQAAAYAALAGALGGRPLVIRTLDAGGDKPLPYLPMRAEPNPFLGARGVRLLLDRPGLLRTQVRAILRAAAAAPVRLMVPMVATLAEWRAVRTAIDEERARLGAPAVPAGLVVEVPAAAILASAFAREADFLSIGTNDLAQYTLAMDRGHPGLAPRVDALDPAVLRLIAMTVDGARAHGKRVGVCGDMAADPRAIPVLVGLGVDELSVAVPAIPTVKAQVRTLDRGACEALARRVLALDHAADVHALVDLEE